MPFPKALALVGFGFGMKSTKSTECRRIKRATKQESGKLTLEVKEKEPTAAFLLWNKQETGSKAFPRKKKPSRKVALFFEKLFHFGRSALFQASKPVLKLAMKGS